jgi:DNA-directed RNA polymerase specialized sigma24 family protein
MDDLLSPLAAGGHFVSVDDWSGRVDEAALQGELRHVVVEAIGVLPPDYRAVLVLHDLEGTGDIEIAEALGMSLAAVTSRVHCSRLFVRRRLSEHLEAA